MIALGNELISIIKKELKIIGILFIVLILLFKIIFYQESLWIIFKLIISLFWAFVLPGFALMYYWHKKLNFLQRIIIGTVFGFVLVSLTSYVALLFELSLKYQAIIIPLLYLIISVFIIIKIKPKEAHYEEIGQGTNI